MIITLYLKLSLKIIRYYKISSIFLKRIQLDCYSNSCSQISKILRIFLKLKFWLKNNFITCQSKLITNWKNINLFNSVKNTFKTLVKKIKKDSRTLNFNKWKVIKNYNRKLRIQQIKTDKSTLKFYFCKKMRIQIIMNLTN